MSVSSTISLSGRALLGRELELRDVTITIKNGLIKEIDELKSSQNAWICPSFFNAHTHLGDTVAMDVRARGSLADLVTPPNGLKHQILAKTPLKRLIEGMHSSIRSMSASGTGGFADFREGGAAGVEALREASAGTSLNAVILGREGGESDADGAGISSARDTEEVEKIVSRMRDLGKPVAFHAGERDPDDVDAALSFEPDLLVHCTHATTKQLKECADMGIPIAVCPRSNWKLGVTDSRDYPPIQKMIDLGCKVLLGTDNVMFVQPDMFQEMAFTSLIYNIPPREIMSMAVRGSGVFGDPHIIEEGMPASLFVIDPARSNAIFSNDPMKTLVNRAHSGWITRTVLNEQAYI